MDSQDSSAPPPHVNHHHHHHQPQPPMPMPSHHALLMGPHTQSQQHPSNMAYQLPNSNNNSVSTTTATSNTAGVMHQQNPGFPFNSMDPAQKPMDHQYFDRSPSAGGGGWFNIEPTRKKRGRPRKYSLDNNIDLGLSPAPVAQISSSAAGGRLDSSGAPSADTPAKRNRGRPPGSGKKQMDSLGVSGVGFVPHVITVDAGEDIASKIIAFSQQGPREVCILSANGAICNVTLRQPAVSGSTVTYEGWFEIISLSGSFLTSEGNGAHSKSGGLSVSLAGSDGRVLGGGVAGVLKAASPVQVVVGSFIAEGKRPKPVPPLAIATSNTLPSSNRLNFGARASEASPSSPGGSSESADENDGNSPAPPHGSSLYANAVQPEQSVPMYSNMGWPNSMKIHPN